MRKLPLDCIEELVEESVFHPSPCKRHRERVLKNAVQATVRQKISRRTIAAVSAAALGLGMGILIVRIATTSGGPASDAATRVGAPTVEVQAAPAAAPTAAAAGSIGEGLYRGADPPDAHAEASEGL